ncbi:MAG: hypothetical protein J0H53_16180 [Rhizobiales bacterium]|nr:hypothetical protein [Hyphomicrobiales bacterium]
MTRPKVDKRLRAHFKEWARRIISQDRSARKYGKSQNTIGEIERALCEAFLLGRTAGAPDQPAERGFVEWIEIPPRARDTLFSISAGLNHGSQEAVPPSIILEPVMIGGRRRWRAVEEDQEDSHTFSDGGVMPLIKFGLLGRLDEPGAGFALTDLGIATCLEFWRRWKDRDPSLPLMGVRGVNRLGMGTLERRANGTPFGARR